MMVTRRGKKREEGTSFLLCYPNYGMKCREIEVFPFSKIFSGLCCYAGNPKKGTVLLGSLTSFSLESYDKWKSLHFSPRGESLLMQKSKNFSRVDETRLGWMEP